MPAKTPKRERSSKKSKPKAPALSFGSSSANEQPSKQLQGGAGGSDADGNATGWPCHEQLSVGDHSGTMDDEALTEADIAEVVRCAREFLEKQGPSQEEELCKVLSPRRMRRMQASSESLAACLARQPGFNLIREGDCSYVYYVGLEEHDVACGASVSSSETSPPPTPVPDSSLLNAASSAGALVEARAAAAGSERASPCSSGVFGSYASALDEQVEERGEGESRNASTQTAFDEEVTLNGGWHSQVGRVTCGTQTTGEWDSSEKLTWLEEMKKWQLERRILLARIACLEGASSLAKELQPDVEDDPTVSHSRPPVEQPRQDEGVANSSSSQKQGQEGSHSPSYLSGEAAVAGACLMEDAVEKGSREAVCPPCQEDSPTAGTNEKASVEAAVGTKHETPAAPSKLQGEVMNVERPRVLEFAELCWQLEQSRAGTNSGRESSQGGPSCIPPKSRSEAQLDRIVKSVKKKKPRLTEGMIRLIVDQVRCIQRGFSGMTLQDIEALVLSHIENTIGKKL